jgi:zinc protease
MSRMATVPATPAELAARKSVLVGGFGRDLGTTDGLAGVLGGLAVSGVDLGEMNLFTARVEAVTAADVQNFARDIFDPSKASVIVVGDSKLFGADVAAALPGAEVIKIDELNLDVPSLKTPAAAAK